MRATEDLTAALRQVDNDRAYVRHMRELVDRLDVALNREEAHLHRALQIVVEGQAQHVNVAGVPITFTSKSEHRHLVLGAFDGPGERISQVELQRHLGIDSGALSRAVRDLEIDRKLRRVGRTKRRSPLWERVE